MLFVLAIEIAALAALIGFTGYTMGHRRGYGKAHDGWMRDTEALVQDARRERMEAGR